MPAGKQAPSPVWAVQGVAVAIVAASVTLPPFTDRAWTTCWPPPEAQAFVPSGDQATP
jgi:hypothetical protein